MGTLTAEYIIGQCQELTQDEDGEVFTTPQGLEWVNDAQRAIAIVRVDSSVSRAAIQLVPGIKQSITGRRLITVHYNMGADGLTIGAPVRLVERTIKDDSDPGWTTEAESTEILEYMYDGNSPKNFDVSPPVHSSINVWAEVTQAVNPTDCATVGSTIDLDDAYAPAMIEWVMYRFFGRDSEETPNHQRAMSYFSSFFNLLGEKMKADMFSNPYARKQSNR